jgi:hypothetical protein
MNTHRNGLSFHLQVMLTKDAVASFGDDPMTIQKTYCIEGLPASTICSTPVLDRVLKLVVMVACLAELFTT